jgi:HTH-type transcriptional regulator, sugar sensing transcriptional regulator
MKELIHHLQMFDLTDNEARTYLAFLTYGSMNGYEVAKKCNIARGNIYSCLQRLVEKGALAKDDKDKFTPIPLEVFFENYQLQLGHSQKTALGLLHKHIHQQKEEAQVLSLSGYENIFQRSQSILNRADSKLVLVAAFAPELNSLKDELLSLQKSDKEVNVLSFGPKPAWLHTASEHMSEDLIEKAQGGRLFMIAAFPQALIAVIRADGTASGIWAWNRYLASAIGLYISHEILITKMWPMLDNTKQQEILNSLPDLSSKIALAGVIPDLPLDDYVSGAITPHKVRKSK